MRSPSSLPLTTLLLAASLAGPLAARAETYDALCDDQPCRIRLDGRGLAGPIGFLPLGRIAQWSSGGDQSYDAASGTAGALGGGTAGAMAGGLLLGPVGLVGGLVGGAFAGSRMGNRADLHFTVIGYDAEGRRQSQSFRFVNPRPANRLRSDLPLITGLAMGQVRPMAELRAAGPGAGGWGNNASQLPERLDSGSALPQQGLTPGGAVPGGTGL